MANTLARAVLSWARVAYGVIAAVGVVLIAVFVLGYAAIRSISGCDIHEGTVSVSPDGKWQARSNIEGCHGLLLTTWFDSKVTLAKINKGATEKPQTVFESDVSDPIVLTWTGPRQLNIDVGNISKISTSARSHQEITITYSVPEWVMRNLAQIHVRPDYLNNGKMSDQDRRTAEKVARDYQLYLVKFRKWTEDYTLPSHP